MNFQQLLDDHGVDSLKVKTVYAHVCKGQDQGKIKKYTNILESMYMGSKWTVDGEIAYELVKTYKK